ncbi:unnamed protein product [Arabis nemorensis]|uniref:Two-component response regulator n=1 Tax=Arabis nemorensis TaxID=586526 RepID=A0A565CMG7_9BRAS|nr:unnamed protein product [Arabis nemorensis]
MEKGFSPVGLRVLVVDDDPTWLKILEKMLKKCSYEVTTCGLAREALKLLRERKDGYDIVISDVNMPDMDGFKLLEHVGLELDLPVIMMSVDGETSRVMKGVQHGACDYLLKPIRMKELKIIWQHVLRKKLQEVRDIEGCYEGSGADWMTRNEEVHFLGGGEDVSFGKKRKDFDFERKLLQDESDPSSSKKARVVWSFELHQKFVNAVNQIGCDHKAGPKKILDLMNVPWLTRENVASHLQKYRLYLSRLEKGKELKCYSGGAKNMDSSLKDAEVNSGHQSPGKSSYAFSLLHKATETDPKASASVSDPNSDVHMPPNAKKTRIGFDPPLSSSAFDSLLLWNDVPEALESKPPILYDNSFIQQQPLPSQSSYVATSAPSLMEEEMKPSYETPAGRTCVSTEFIMPQDKSPTVTLQNLDLSSPSAISCMKLQEFSSNVTNNNTESILRSLNWELSESHHSGSLDTDLDLNWLQGERFLANTGLLQFHDYSSSPSLLSELPPHLWFGNERLLEPDEYSFMVDQGLFIS